MMWVNDGLPLLVNSLITEYDIKRGNISIMKQYHLREDAVPKLESLNKERRVREVGLLQREDRAFAKQLEQGFDGAVNQFIEGNGLDRDVDVLAIRRDAVFVVNRPITLTDIGEHIHFRIKNQYHAHLQIGPKLEFYFGQGNRVHIKNFVQEEKDTNHALQKLEPGMISFLQEFIELAESSNMNRGKIYEWMRDFCTLYRDRALDVEYYREFTRDALFCVREKDGASTMLEGVPDYMIEDLDISYNYMNIIVPLLQILV
jgi:hypothetical protein